MVIRERPSKSCLITGYMVIRRAGSLFSPRLLTLAHAPPPSTLLLISYDMVCPMKTAWDLHRALPEAEIIIVCWKRRGTVHLPAPQSRSLAGRPVFLILTAPRWRACPVGR